MIPVFVVPQILKSAEQMCQRYCLLSHFFLLKKTIQLSNSQKTTNIHEIEPVLRIGDYEVSYYHANAVKKTTIEYAFADFDQERIFRNERTAFKISYVRNTPEIGGK